MGDEMSEVSIPDFKSTEDFVAWVKIWIQKKYRRLPLMIG